MATNESTDVVTGFILEAQSYIPKICEAIEALSHRLERPDLVETAHRYSHIIKGASPMVGLDALGEIARLLFHVFDDVQQGLVVDDALIAALRFATTQMEACLKSGEGVHCELVLGTTLQKFTEAGYSAPLPGQASGGASEFDLPLGLEFPPPSDVDTIAVPLMPPPFDDTAGDFDLSAPPFDAVVEVTEIPPLDSASGADDLDEPSWTELANVVAQDMPVGAGEDVGDDHDDDADISAQLLEAFELEAEDHLTQIAVTLNQLLLEPTNIALLDEVRRSVHTLKGAAATVGQKRVADLAHRAEDLMEKLCDASMEPSSDALHLLVSTADNLEDMVAAPADPAAFDASLMTLYQSYDALLKRDTLVAVVPPPPAAALAHTTGGNGANAPASNNGSQRKSVLPGLAGAGPQIRVPLDGLDDLVKVVSEVVVNRSSFQEYFGNLGREAAELRLSAARLRGISDRLQRDYEASALGGAYTAANFGGVQVKSAAGRGGAGFDELEFDRYTEFHLRMRELTETMSDLDAVSNEINTTIGDFDSVLNRMGRLSSEMQSKLMRLRMVPFATVATRLSRTVRVTASQLGKQAVLSLEGDLVELDKGVLDDMVDPLLHLMRNAVDHGIEAPDKRKALGKKPTGEVRVSAVYEGAQVVIRVGDDGSGIDLERLRQRAIEGGFVSEAHGLALADDELFELVFLPGFSTAAAVTQISGRGVGLDVVRANVQAMKGTISLSSKPGLGTTFTVRLPMTLAITRVLLVGAAGETYALPMDNIVQLIRTDASNIAMVGKRRVLRRQGGVLPLISLAEALGVAGPSPDDDDTMHKPVLVVQAGGEYLAIVVDSLHGGREVAVKRLGNHLRNVRGVAAATLMGDGSVVLILNPIDLTQAARSQTSTSSMHQRGPVNLVRQALDVLIVDDSLSVRRVVSNLMRKVGWRATLARDGVEALETLAASTVRPDVVLLDIEMPRMDGYELAAALRADERYHDLPIVMLTSRAGAKHRERAQDLGVDEYMVKPYSDAELLAVIAKVTNTDQFLPVMTPHKVPDVARV